jgi:hypothetical protein
MNLELVIITAVVLYVLVRLVYSRSDKEKVCTACGYAGYAKHAAKGSFIIEVILWLCFIIPGLIYSIWRQCSYRYICPKCNHETVIPLDSPIGRKLVEETKTRKD